MSSIYNNPYFHDNVYGHTVQLLKRHGNASGVHLDIGCNLGPIAEPIRDEIGRAYIGFDISEAALADLDKRGFETARIDLSDVDEAEKIIKSCLDGREIASISILDTLEHLSEPAAVATMLRKLANDHAAPLVVSVPNIAHRDIGFKLAFGRWDYTATGLMDHTHLRGFTADELSRVMNGSGWHLVDQHNVYANVSDQHFPQFHPAVAHASSLNVFLSTLRDKVDSNATVNQFVGLYLAGHITRHLLYIDQAEQKRPFLTIVTRTQGRRLDTLRDVLLCLSAQTCQDFEALIIGHKLSAEVSLQVERVIEDTNEEMRRKVRFVKVHEGNRTRPLNVGFEQARGEYIAILDDDDIVLGHWVEEFYNLATKLPGRVLRSGVVAQTWKQVRPSYGSTSVRAVSGMQADFAPDFDFLQHLIQNQTPPVSMAVPRCSFQELGIRFDESLSTTEDWDFLMRTANICGATSSSEITSIYRKWDGGESSFTVHTLDEWRSNHHAIWRKLDLMPLLLEKGSATRIRHLVEDWNQRNGRSPALLGDPQLDGDRYANALREDIHGILNSATWKAGAPLRFFASLLGRPFIYPRLWAMSAPQLEQYQDEIRRSRSWRIVQKVKRLLRR
ncbi:methyltransferase domain-containing protein [Xanthomonas euvesicatoria]|uniref:methyltransferase domain-containing protein n=1 Tax=Xanthomonas euvesicatoria TaxID=456327 RepID=UPI0024073DB9|nr:methyltransferase domain-containing protein [Xanthomonas euvesicatoria]MCP3043457.1 methyltransferase domain-containing protein [Xanthomonas euvesicatoria pv. allii]